MAPRLLLAESLGPARRSQRKIAESGCRRVELATTVETDSVTQLWYLAYGSNLQASLLARYLAAPPDSRETRWARLERSLYFAGDSRHWRGPVAFVSLNPTTDSTMYTACLAIRVTPEELQRVFRAENGLDAALGSVCDLLDVGEWVEILMRRPEDSRQGKYNVVLRGPDIAGQPSFTFTTARTLPVGTPSSAYARAIEEGVGSWQGSDAASRYVSRRTQPSTGDNRIHLAARGHSHVWSGEISRGKFSGYPAVRLPRSLSPVEGAQNFLGESMSMATTHVCGSILAWPTSTTLRSPRR